MPKLVHIDCRFIHCTRETTHNRESKQTSMAVLNLFHVIGRNLTVLFLFKLVLLWSLVCFAPLQAVNSDRQGFFKQIEGIQWTIPVFG